MAVRPLEGLAQQLACPGATLALVSDTEAPMFTYRPALGQAFNTTRVHAWGPFKGHQNQFLAQISKSQDHYNTTDWFSHFQVLGGTCIDVCKGATRQPSYTPLEDRVVSIFHNFMLLTGSMSLHVSDKRCNSLESPAVVD